VFLEPEEPISYAGKVLTYGTFVFTHGAPQITASQSLINYEIPGDPTLKEVKISPAQSFAGNKISFLGNGFNIGTPKILLINPILWQQDAKEADASWLVTMINENQIDMTVQPTNGPDTIIPGLYSAQLSMTELKKLPNGTTKTFEQTSNVFPFFIMPRVTINPLVPATSFTVTGGIFQHAQIKTDDVQVFVGENKLTFKPLGTPLASNEFSITDAATITLVVPATTHGANIPLRILVKGVESPPNWISIP
jgi:hypothetical protein